MPALVVSSQYTTDSQILRHTAQQLGWETIRLEGQRVPDWFEPPDDQIALFFTAPHAFHIASQLSRALLGCNPAWTVHLPAEFVRREMRQMTLEAALRLPGKSFVKHAVSKAFPAAIYDARTLAEVAQNVHPRSLVHVVEPIEWIVEYRCFVVGRDVVTLSPYKRHGRVISDHSDMLGASPTEMKAARDFCSCVVQSEQIACPPAFVLDVGRIENRGWAVVEFNECWASGIYACDPGEVLKTLLFACVPLHSMSDELRRWDFSQHYAAACPG